MNELLLDDWSILQGRKPFMWGKYAAVWADGKNVKIHHLVIGFPPKGKWAKQGKKGVYFDGHTSRTKPWKAIVVRFGKKYNLGYFLTKEEASQARDKFLEKEKSFA